MPTGGDVSKFFDETLAEMVEHSPAVQNLHPLLRDMLLQTARGGDMKARQRVLKTLLKEVHGYVELADRLQKQYGINPEEYIKKLEAWVKKDIAKESEKGERADAEQKAVRKLQKIK